MFKKKILVIDDSSFYAKAIRMALPSEEFDMTWASNGNDGLAMVASEKPDLVLLDVVMKDMSGLEVCKILRASPSNNLMPIIMLSAQDGQEDKLVGLELGADDYITKPFNQRELLSRVKNTILRIDRNRGANPLTGLQGNHEIQREIESRIARDVKFSVIYIDLDNFKAFNDVYGFFKGDTAIKLTADILRDAVSAYGSKDDFIGHIGGDDFVAVISLENYEAICRDIVGQFDIKIKELYSKEHLEQGYVRTVNRLGATIDYPVMTVSLAVVANEKRNIESCAQVADIAADLKRKVKTIEGSNYLIDRRVGQFL